MMCGPRSVRLMKVMKQAAPSWGQEDGGLDLREQKSPRVPWGHRPAPEPTSRSSSVALAPRPSSVVAPLLHGEGLASMWTFVFQAETFKQPGKMNVFDHSVVLDLGHWVARRASAEMLWDFTQAELGNALRRAAGSLGLAPLRPCLYQCRHGGASHDRFVGARPLLEVQQRGGWGSFQSVQLYERHGRVGMEMQMLPIDMRNRLLGQERGSAGRCAVIFAAHFAQLRPVRGVYSSTSSPAVATSRGRSEEGGKLSWPSTSCWGRSSISLALSSTPS
jgi:hypothetical protein